MLNMPPLRAVVNGNSWFLCLCSSSGLGCGHCFWVILFVCAFSALTPLVGLQEGHLACKKAEWWDAGMVICLERGADLHMAQLIPLPLTVSCFNKIQIGLPSWYWLTRIVLDKGPLNALCVCSLVHTYMRLAIVFDFWLHHQYCIWIQCWTCAVLNSWWVS